MKTETKTTFIADDGTRFYSEEDCRRYEEKCSAFRERLEGKIGKYSNDELLLGGHARLDELPFEAPWLSPFGACFIMVTNVRRTDGVLEFQLADGAGVPYSDGNEWCKAGAFYSEWPD